MFPRQGIDRFGPFPAIRSSISARRIPHAVSVPRFPRELAMLLRLSAVVAAVTVMTAVVLSAGA